MDLKEFYTSQSESVKARLGACKSEEEMMRVLDEEGIELDPEMLDNISGGMDQIITQADHKTDHFEGRNPIHDRSWC